MASSFLAATQNSVCMQDIVSVCSSADACLSWFHFLAFVSSVVLKQGSVDISVVLIPRVVQLGHTVVLFYFFGTSILISRVASLVSIPTINE